MIEPMSAPTLPERDVAGPPAWLESACRAFEADPTPTVAAVARACGIDRTTLHRAFVDCLGLAPGAYRSALRARRLRRALAAAGTVTEALYEAGFSGPSRAYAAAHGDLGLAPGRIHDGGRGLTLQYLTGRCSLGPVLVASSQHGLCLVEFLDDERAARERIAERFPLATAVAADARAGAVLSAVVAGIDDPARAPALPLDIRGTAFQRRVWQALRALRFGERISYGELAARIGRPGAARAVAGACAANRLAVLVPCHRVVGADGRMGGYRWGSERKEALLAREAAGEVDAGPVDEE